MYIRRGLQALRAAQSPFVVQYFTAFQDHDHLFVVTDYVSEVSLHHLLQRFTVRRSLSLASLKLTGNTQSRNYPSTLRDSMLPSLCLLSASFMATMSSTELSTPGTVSLLLAVTSNCVVSHMHIHLLARPSLCAMIKLPSVTCKTTLLQRYVLHTYYWHSNPHFS